MKARIFRKTLPILLSFCLLLSLLILPSGAVLNYIGTVDYDGNTWGIQGRGGVYSITNSSALVVTMSGDNLLPSEEEGEFILFHNNSFAADDRYYLNLSAREDVSEMWNAYFSLVQEIPSELASLLPLIQCRFQTTFTCRLDTRVQIDAERITSTAALEQKFKSLTPFLGDNFKIASAALDTESGDFTGFIEWNFSGQELDDLATSSSGNILEQELSSIEFAFPDNSVWIDESAYAAIANSDDTSLRFSQFATVGDVRITLQSINLARVYLTQTTSEKEFYVLRFPTEMFHLTYDGNGDDNGSTATTVLSSGTLVTVEGTSWTRTGYIFREWNTEADGTGDVYAPGAAFEILSDAILYAQWDAVEHTVSFEMNGHGAQVPAQTVPSGASATTPADPAEGEYIFGGWFTDSSLETPYDFAAPVTGDTIVYAKWTLIENPPTGDAFFSVLCIAAVSAAGILLLLRKRRRKED